MRLKNVLFCSALGLIALTSCKTVDEGINESELNEDRRDTVPAGSSYFPLPSGTEAVYAIKDMKMDVNTNGGETRAFITFSMKHCTDILGPVHTSVDFNSKGDKANLYVSATGIRTSQAKTARCASSGVQTSEVFVTKRKIDSKNVKLIPVVKSATVEKGTSMADIAKADGLVPTKASAAGLVASWVPFAMLPSPFPRTKVARLSFRLRWTTSLVATLDLVRLPIRKTWLIPPMMTQMSMSILAPSRSSIRTKPRALSQQARSFPFRRRLRLSKQQTNLPQMMSICTACVW